MFMAVPDPGTISTWTPPTVTTTLCGINPAACSPFGQGASGLGGSGEGGGAVAIRPQNVAFSFAKSAQQLVTSGALTDCDALAAFASSIAPLFGSTSDFVEAFGVLTPSALSNITPGVAWNSNPVFLNPASNPQPSGYAAQYQNTLPDNADTGWNGDQGHHFAAFFQAGYLYGSNAAGMAAWALEYWQGLDSGIMNLGDVNLGEVAAQIGADLRSGVITTAQVGNAIKNNLCQH
jgi:hypothetical protein